MIATAPTASSLLALSKATTSLAEARPAPGTYIVDEVVSVHIKGVLSISEDTEKTPTVSIPLKEVLALFIARSGATRESSISLLRECLADALKGGTKGEGAVAAAAEIDAAFKEEVAALTASLPKTPVKGAVRWKGEAEVVEVV